MTVAATATPTTDASQPREAWDGECSLASNWRYVVSADANDAEPAHHRRGISACGCQRAGAE